MAELRLDHLHDTWIIVAPERQGRPHDVQLKVVPGKQVACPFCPGNEGETPSEVLALGRPAGEAPNQPPWTVRVFPNRYPAVAESAGRHEVVVLSPDHQAELADLDAEQLSAVLLAVQKRIRSLEAEPGLVSALFFLNAGAGAGASLSHPHGQLLATPVVPSVLRTELEALAGWRREHGGCLLCHLVAEARADDRIVAENEAGVVLVPWASRFSYEMLLVPNHCAPRLTGVAVEPLSRVAALLGEACRALQTAVDHPPYNLALHSAPLSVDDFHWHLEILPRLAPLAGFETGTGFFINPIDPLTAATALRSAKDLA